MADKIIYKNYCIPQEKLPFSDGDRWYLDSDSGRKLAGAGESQSTSIGAPVTGTFSDDITLSDCLFIYVKNTDTSGSDYLTLWIGGMGVAIKIGPGEAFASDVDNGIGSAITVRIGGSGTPGFEYIKGA